MMDMHRDDSPLSANEKPLYNAFVVIGDSYYRVKDYVAQDEVGQEDAENSNAEHSDGVSAQNF